MIVIVTDFGLEGPYVGQMMAVLYRDAPGVPVVNLFADAPAHDPRAAAYLLAAYAGEFPVGTVFLCVVDPGVGGDRRPLVVSVDGRWLVGPDNGLFAPLTRRAGIVQAWEIDWRPGRLSASFHGRDLFAPVAARLARGEPPPGFAIDSTAVDRPDWPEDLAEIVYIDRFGNCMTGLRARAMGDGVRLLVGGRVLSRARTFSDVAAGAAFWYENANGLVEIAVNRGRAVDQLGLAVGSGIGLRTEPDSGPARCEGD